MNIYTNDDPETAANLNSLCPVCGGDHNVLVISLENSGHIVTRPFPKEKATRVKVNSGIKVRATRLDPVGVFWSAEEAGY
jgi:hypothetical protein